jgi:hypothetical protein
MGCVGNVDCSVVFGCVRGRFGCLCFSRICEVMGACSVSDGAGGARGGACCCLFCLAGKEFTKLAYKEVEAVAVAVLLLSLTMWDATCSKNANIEGN